MNISDIKEFLEGCIEDKLEVIEALKTDSRLEKSLDTTIEFENGVVAGMKLALRALNAEL